MKTVRVLRTAKDRHYSKGSVHTAKYYCLRCEMPGICKCSMSDKKFHHSTNLRPPLSTKNKARFRAFLDACPQFANCVPPELLEDFRNLLRKVKYFGTQKSEFMWSRVSAS